MTRYSPRVAFRCALALSFGAALASSEWSQTQAPPPRSKDQIRVVTTEVIAPVTVTDPTGEFVLDLAQKDFHVFDDGVEQTIDHWDLGGDPLAVVLVLETSSRPHAMIPVIHSLGSIFTETAMALDGEGAVITYDSTVEVRQPFTQDHGAIEEAIGGAKFEEPERRLYDAMDLAVQTLKAEPPKWRRIVLIVGESRDGGQGESRRNCAGRGPRKYLDLCGGTEQRNARPVSVRPRTLGSSGNCSSPTRHK